MRDEENSPDVRFAGTTGAERKYRPAHTNKAGSYHLITLQFENANTNCAITGVLQLKSSMSVFLGRDPSGWRKNSP